MRNLLAQFSPQSFTVFTQDVPKKLSAPTSFDDRVLTVRTDPPFTRRGRRFWIDFAQPFVERRIQKAVREVSPAMILAVYPSLHMFSAAIHAAETNQVPWVAYLHDMLAEPYHGSKYEPLAEDVQRRMFRSARAILVTGQGMADLYRAKYSVECVPLEIGYCEPFAVSLLPRPIGPPYAFMGGSIYNVNDKATTRIIEGAEQAGVRFRLATAADWKALASAGIMPRPGIEKHHFLVRKEYLESLRNQHILAVVLNWPDETATPEDELATAFPTKVVEYLASGQPILVHCPENYFLARFFLEHECGAIVSTRDVTAIAAAIRSLLSDSKEQDRMRANALRAARMFSIDRISLKLRQVLQDAFQREGRESSRLCGPGEDGTACTLYR